MTRKHILVWFRRDLRMDDHPALCAALARGAAIPVFVWAPDEEAPWRPGAASRWWLHQSLTCFAEQLAKAGSRLIIRKGDSLKCLQALLRETGASGVYWNRGLDPAVTTRDTAIKTALRVKGFEAESFAADSLSEPWKIKTGQGTPYKVFTAYYHALLAQNGIAAPLPAPKKIPAPSDWPKSLTVKALALEPLIPWTDGIRRAWAPGERSAQKWLEVFVQDKIADYHEERDRPDHSGTSRLSPHLHFGEISPRRIWHRLNRGTRALPYLRQLVWRDFAAYLLFHFPETARHNMRPAFNAFPWAKDRASLRIWQKGRTGYPFVDAGMRELWTTGWMHNRVRMAAASFLVKHLLIHWREGAVWFWDTLVDADLANNTMGWQWVAGSGADAAPYFRIFNPVIQGERFDPQGAYVRKWVPEIARLPDRWIHKPWQAPAETLRTAGVMLGKSYPKPVVEHEYARRRALASYEKIKK